MFGQVADEGATVPALWRLEVANSLTVAVHRRRIDQEFRRAALALLLTLPPTRKLGVRQWTSPIGIGLLYMTRPISNWRIA